MVVGKSPCDFLDKKVGDIFCSKEAGVIFLLAVFWFGCVMQLCLNHCQLWRVR
jgi:hypothetical protein